MTAESETQALKAAWMKHARDFLDHYLVRDVEDPRINLQSILTRSILIEALWPGRFQETLEEELRFGACMNEVLRVCKQRRSPLTRKVLWKALETGADRHRDLAVPPLLRSAYQRWNETGGVPNYLEIALREEPGMKGAEISERALNVYVERWKSILPQPGGDDKRLSVVEPACGSANDYRFMDAMGLAPFLDYAGFDLCEKNIANAIERFPKSNFIVGDARRMPVSDGSFEVLYMHDLLEHLSLEGMRDVLDETLRVTTKLAVLSFFNLADAQEHEVRQVESYHWNRLSLDRILEVLEPMAERIDVVHIPTVMREKFECPRFYNQEAMMLIVHFA